MSSSGSGCGGNGPVVLQVRWADIEEGKKQAAARDRGFVLGQTDWSRMTDLSFGSNALVQVRYIEGRDSAK
ncbi:YLP motif-containing protein 1 [Portunus trituberculatus]|uniref:YLP motif-containing protein 1 n=1 Tax=Portunus trituberculatus TaxID=210409 RepID=A0A5B7J7P3_PORTR|nr:YLP motif-containing protein 1 [Portunus trituberculatus]